MSGLSPEVPNPRRGRTLLLVLWAGLFLLLLETLPRWSRRVPCDEPTAVQLITDDSSTLVAFSVRLHRTDSGDTFHPTWPIRLIDLPTGRQRMVNRPEEPADPAELRDDFGTRYRAAGGQTLHTKDQETAARQSGDYLALTYETIASDIPAKRLQVLNWRTGEVLVDGPFEGTCRFFGPRLLVSQQDGGARLEIWNAEARTITRADWLPGFQDFESTVISPDGRWLMLYDAWEVWDLAKGEVGFQVPKGYEEAVFSPDGGELILVSRFQREGRGQPTRIWRSFDTRSGKLLREEQETLDWPVNRSPPRSPGWIYFLGDAQTVRYDQAGGGTEWSPQGLQRQPPTPEEEEDTENWLESPWTFIARSADGKWGVAAPEPDQFTPTLSTLFLSYLFPQSVGSSSDPFPYQLWDLTGRRRIATLGRGASNTCWLTPDDTRVVTQMDHDLLVWDIPPKRPWGRAAAWSCTLPLAALLWSLRRRRPSRSPADESGHPAPAAASTPG